MWKTYVCVLRLQLEVLLVELELEGNNLNVTVRSGHSCDVTTWHMQLELELEPY
jgi:hypothetical protein